MSHSFLSKNLSLKLSISLKPSKSLKRGIILSRSPLKIGKSLMVVSGLMVGLQMLGLQNINAYAQESDPAKLSLAAGYKATFTCSSVFNSGRSVAQINNDELNRIYPDYREALAQLPSAVIDRDAKTVSVKFADAFPPRVSLYRGRFGCTQLPTGSDVASFKNANPLPAVDIETTPLSKRDWPVGDKVKGRLFSKTRAGRGLRAKVEDAFDRETYGEGTETTAVLVVRDGKIIAEKYREGFDKYTGQRTWSVAKSIMASILGAAVHQNMIDVKEKAGLAQWLAAGDPRGEITLENLLHMGSGLDNGPRGNRTDDIYFGGGRVVDHAVTRRLVVAPASRWYYANNDTMLAIRALRERMNDDEAFAKFPYESVLNKIGMNKTFLETDWNGDFILSSQVYTTSRDLARLGLLYLNDGVWNGERILAEGWSEYVATPAPVQPPNRRDGSKRFGYGAQFWLLGGFEGLPEDTYAALGNRGQYLIIIPSKNILVIRRGFDDNGGAQFDIAKFASDILKSL